MLLLRVKFRIFFVRIAVIILIFRDDKMYTANVLVVIVTFFSHDPVSAVHM